MGWAVKDIADRFDVAECTINRIKRGETPDMAKTEKTFNDFVARELTKVNCTYSTLPKNVMEQIILKIVKEY